MGRVIGFGLFALFFAQLALPLGAFTTPADGSFDELFKLVYTNAEAVICLDMNKVYESGWYERIRDISETAGMSSERTTPTKDGKAIVFVWNLIGQPQFLGLCYWKDSDNIDALFEQEESRLKSSVHRVTLEKIEVDGAPGFKIESPDIAEAINFVQMAPDWFVIGNSEQVMASYMEWPARKLGISPAMAKILDHYKGKAIFGTIMLPKKQAGEVISRVDFMLDLSDNAMSFEMVMVCSGNKAAVKLEKLLNRRLPLILAVNDRKMPGISELVADSLRISTYGEKITVAVRFTEDQVVELGGIIMKYRKELLKRRQAMEASESETESATSVESEPALESAGK
ncbi:MAG: hypothetical protein AB7F40_05350 [Victivallaceae bacterium]|nr:hypothetical protein [Victivallaceae bacterium]